MLFGLLGLPAEMGITDCDGRNESCCGEAVSSLGELIAHGYVLRIPHCLFMLSC